MCGTIHRRIFPPTRFVSPPRALKDWRTNATKDEVISKFHTFFLNICGTNTSRDFCCHLWIKNIEAWGMHVWSTRFSFFWTSVKRCAKAQKWYACRFAFRPRWWFLQHSTCTSKYGGMKKRTARCAKYKFIHQSRTTMHAHIRCSLEPYCRRCQCSVSWCFASTHDEQCPWLLWSRLASFPHYPTVFFSSSRPSTRNANSRLSDDGNINSFTLVAHLMTAPMHEVTLNISSFIQVMRLRLRLQPRTHHKTLNTSR